MRNIVKQMPIPIVGLMLALAATGNLVMSYGIVYRNIFGILSAIILVLMLMKIIKYPKEVLKSLDNIVVASVFPAFTMGIMLLSTYISGFSTSLAYSLWIIGLIFHIILIIYFTKKHVFNFNIKKVFPSWFIVYVGIVAGTVTAPVFRMENIGQILFWLGFILYLILLPITLKRVLNIKEIPEPALPTIVILSAPASLCLTGYMNSFPNKNIFFVYFLLALSQFTLLCVLLQLPKLLKLQFYPSYSAFTFPLVISATSIKLTNAFLIDIEKPLSILKYIIKFEEIVAVGMTIYVLYKYIKFLFTEAETVK
ncbi:TDT family transporter [Anaerosalibacter massiliensis]|uniref:TDT family transporter n=1 Tax=Anaerosalibacter massiliensis TaxID=1347392 RepID=UPI0005B26667|nr:TDT family transporter [Anaerosalibacter massiliensis]